MKNYKRIRHLAKEIRDMTLDKMGEKCDICLRVLPLDNFFSDDGTVDYRKRDIKLESWVHNHQVTWTVTACRDCVNMGWWNTNVKVCAWCYNPVFDMYRFVEYTGKGDHKVALRKASVSPASRLTIGKVTPIWSTAKARYMNLCSTACQLHAWDSNLKTDALHKLAVKFALEDASLLYRHHWKIGLDSSTGFDVQVSNVLVKSNGLHIYFKPMGDIRMWYVRTPEPSQVAKELGFMRLATQVAKPLSERLQHRNVKLLT